MSRYIQKSLIGSGTYGKVYEGIDTETNEKVALKLIQLNEKEGIPGTAIREISILKKLSHHNIIKLESVIHTENILTLVFEFVDFELLPFVEKNKNPLPLMKQLVEGVHYLHTQDVVHRDLKPQNILVSKNGVLKIADFGLARNMEIKLPPYSSEVVTLWYRSPELLLGSADYNAYIDIWSLGCIMYEMLSLKPLFPGEDKDDQLRLIKVKTGSQACFRKYLVNCLVVPEFILEIICKCLVVDHRKRISIHELMTILEQEIGNK